MAWVTPPFLPPQHRPRPFEVASFPPLAVRPPPPPRTHLPATFPRLPSCPLPAPPRLRLPPPSRPPSAFAYPSGLIISFLFLSVLSSPAVSLPASRCPFFLFPSLWSPPFHVHSVSLTISAPPLSLIQQLTSFPDTFSPPKYNIWPAPALRQPILPKEAEETSSPPTKKAIPPFWPVAHSAPATGSERRWQRSARQRGLRPLFGLQTRSREIGW